MFAMQCKITEPHQPHTFVKRWRKIQLPFLRNPENYPDSWNAAYYCSGISEIRNDDDLPGMWSYSDFTGGQDEAEQHQQQQRIDLATVARSNSLYLHKVRVKDAPELITDEIAFSGDELTRVKRGGKLYISSMYGKV